MKIKRNNEESTLSHTKWNCIYYIIFSPKYRRKAIYGKLRSDLGKYLRRLCEYKGVEIVEANACSDHMHMLVKIPPKNGNRYFWAERYYVSTVGLNKATIKKYIQNQEEEGRIKDKISLKEYKDLFTSK